MAIAIIGTVLGLCSCIGLIVGIFAIVSATQVSAKWQAGDVMGAQASAKQARTLGIIAIVLGVIGFVFGGIYNLSYR